nr:hypothetical protein [Vibrio vulnificus]
MIKSLCGSFCIACLHPLTRRYESVKISWLHLFFVFSAFQFWSCRQVTFSGRCFLDSNSWALKIQRVASLNSRM